VKLYAENGLINSLCKLAFTNSLDADWIGHCAKLVELSEQIVKVNFSTRVRHESLPVAASSGMVLSLK
jgi:hypothetical protein